MSSESNKDLARRLLLEAFAGGRLEILDDILAPSYVDHDAPPGTPAGPAGIKAIMSTFRAAFPDLRFEIEDQIAEGDRVVTRYTFHGTHRGELMGIPATGRTVAMPGISCYVARGGVLQEAWVRYDALGLMRQLSA